MKYLVNIKQYIKSICELKKETTNNDDDKDFFSSRQYECQVTELSKLIASNNLINQIKNIYQSEKDAYIKNPKQRQGEQLDIIFTYFWIVFTYYRRQNNFSEMETFYLQEVEQFGFEFNNYPIKKHIDLLNKANSPKFYDKYDRLIKQSERMRKEHPSLSTQPGIIHHYCEMIAIYYERHLDLKDEKEDNVGQKQIKDALNKINDLIKEAEKNNSIDNIKLLKDKEYDEEQKIFNDKINEAVKYNLKVYDKYYVTRGRLLALSHEYALALESINKGIQKVYESSSPNKSTIDSYKLIANNISLIQAFDTSNSNYETLKSIKTDNFKVISIMTALLGFLLGSIEIFARVDEPIRIVLYICAYLGLILILLGICLVGVSLVLDDLKKKQKIYSIIILCIGALILTASLITAGII